MKFLHAADIHLDSPLAGLGATTGAPVDALRGRDAPGVRDLVDLALDEGVDFVVIAGDLYDGDWKDFNTGLFFAARDARLGRHPVLPAARQPRRATRSSRRRLTLPPNVREFSSRTCRDAYAAATSAWRCTARASPTAPCPRISRPRYRDAAAGPAQHRRAAHLAPRIRASTRPTRPAASRRWRRRATTTGRSAMSTQPPGPARASPGSSSPATCRAATRRRPAPKGCTLVTVEDGRDRARSSIAAVDVLRWAAVEVDAAGRPTRPRCDARLAEARARRRRRGRGPARCWRASR